MGFPIYYYRYALKALFQKEKKDEKDEKDENKKKSSTKKSDISRIKSTLFQDSFDINFISNVTDRLSDVKVNDIYLLRGLMK